MVFLFPYINGYTQENMLNKTISIEFHNNTLKEALEMISQQEKIAFAYNNLAELNKRVTQKYNIIPVSQVLNSLFEGTSLKYHVIAGKITIYSKENTSPKSNKKKTVTISGFVEDAATRERLLGASVYDTILKHGAASNDYGFYSLTIPSGKINLLCTYVGYEPQVLNLFLSKDTVINIQIKPSVEIDEVIVTSQKNPVKENQMSMIDIPLNTIKKLPVILGETDIMKSIQMMPGIQGGVEGSSGIYVRGGSPDQNLVLIDGVPVYNINHLFGFFSVFNSDAISNFSVIKGGFPARYGGHLSSVIDVRMKEGNMQERNTSYNIGLLTSSFTTEGPIIKNKCSYILSARRSYLDLIAVPAEWLISKIAYDGEEFTAGYFFDDINAKINYKFSDKDRLYLSLYHGKDKLYVNIKNDYGETENKTKSKMNWGNMVTALRWNHIFTPKLFSNASLTYSKFRYNIGQIDISNYIINTVPQQFEDNLSYNSSINDLAANIDFNFIASPSYTARFGFSGIYHMFNPGISVSTFSDKKNIYFDTTYGNSLISGKEFAAYLENEFRIGKRFSFNIGGRLAAFNIRDTLFISPEPRISASALITENFSLKASYSRMKQYVNLLTSTTVGFPTDIWIPSTNLVLPQNSTQYAFSANFNLFDTYDLIIEGYYKDMNNLVEYKEGASLFLNFENIQVKDAEAWENKITQGVGWSYGIESLLRKDLGRLNGWAGYTISWSNRKFDEIDNGRVFPFTYDRRHDVAIAATYKLNDRIDFGFNWVFSTGNAITLPSSNYMDYVNVERYINSLQDDEQVYPIEPEFSEYYENRNNFRVPVYHRLDASVSLAKEKKRGSRTLSFGIYNLYCHSNPFMVLVEPNYENYKVVSKSVYSYGMLPIIPSVSYRFKFK